jgi:serpin B
MKVVDYKTAAEPARRDINAWVTAQTHGQIKDLIPNGALDELTRLVLVNAIYLKAPWNTPFEPRGTEPRTFHRLDGSSIQAPLMALDTQLGYSHGTGWQSVSLPYAGRELAMTVIVPDKGRFAEVERHLGTGLLDDAMAGGGNRRVTLELPKFDFAGRMALGDTLKQLGMVRAFDAGRADFRGIVSDPAEQLHINQVHHKATITVDEKGSEAAAATSVEMEALSARLPPRGSLPPVVLTVDRPFLFAVHDVATGAALFLGRVVDPTK